VSDTLTPDSKISLALVITFLVAMGGMVYRAGSLTHSVDQLTHEVSAMGIAVSDLRERIEQLEVVAAIASERWSRVEDPSRPGQGYPPYKVRGQH
jgi:hypothetical protein